MSNLRLRRIERVAGDNVLRAANDLERMTAEIERLTAENTKLRQALQPFAAFNDALKEWRFGPSKYLLQAARPEDKPFLRWMEPSPPPGVPGALKMEVRILEVWPEDFARAEKLCDSAKQEQK